MYTDDDLSAAVAEGVISPETADGLRHFVERRRATPVADEERFRLLTGFNDIFVTIAIVLLLVALAFLGGQLHPWVGGAAVAGASWGLAEYFTRQRRMALPSIVLLFAFSSGIMSFILGLMATGTEQVNSPSLPAIAAVLAAAATYGHWRRFKVPVTVAAGAMLGLCAVLGLLIWAVPAAQYHLLTLVFAGGLIMFGLAMMWDMRDRARTTRAADVAFWLHLAAAPMIIHPVFSAVGVVGSVGPTLGGAGVAILIYVLLALVSLAIDRRAMLVSALVYVLFAIAVVLREAGTVELGFALAALVIGSLLLLLSAGWQPVRRLVLAPLPSSLRGALPAA